MIVGGEDAVGIAEQKRVQTDNESTVCARVVVVEMAAEVVAWRS